MPAVYVSDANGAFGLTVDIVRHLQLGGHLPPLVVVGIGYPVALLRQTLAPRTRDLTPTVSPVMTDGAGDVVASGGAAAFLAFVADELQPWVRERLPVGPDAVYVGHSLGGLFGASTLFERPAHVPRLRPRQPVDLVGRPRHPPARGGLRGGPRRPRRDGRRHGGRPRDGGGTRARPPSRCRRSPGRR